MSEEYKRWEARYSAPDYIFGKEPNYFLAKCKPLLPASGRVLAVADGEGRWDEAAFALEGGAEERLCRHRLNTAVERGELQFLERLLPPAGH